MLNESPHLELTSFIPGACVPSLVWIHLHKKLNAVSVTSANAENTVSKQNKPEQLSHM